MHFMAHKWLMHGGINGVKITMDDVEDEIAALGPNSLPKGTNRICPAMIYLGNELIAENYVQLSKEGDYTQVTLSLTLTLHRIHVLIFSSKITATEIYRYLIKEPILKFTDYRTHSEITSTYRRF